MCVKAYNNLNVLLDTKSWSLRITLFFMRIWSYFYVNLPNINDKHSYSRLNWRKWWIWLTECIQENDPLASWQKYLS